MKIARVSPIYKKGSKNDPSNYRPISVLSIINKIFEKILHKRLYKYLTKYDILYKYQFGFREGHSTTHALIEATDTIKHAIDNKELTCGIFIDLTKAFDTVDHSILLQKLFHYGIRGNVYNLFKSYLSDRKQYVRVNNENSDMQQVVCGVPQGSVLGPLLFIIYINDLANCCNEGTFRIFADDTGIFCHSKTISLLMEKAAVIMKNIHNWFQSNKLTLNTSKTSFLIFRSSRFSIQQLPDTINFGNSSIHRTSQIKYLGVILDEFMNWNAHIQDLCNNLKCLFPLFYNIRDYLNDDHVKIMYYTMVFSKIKYGSIVYGLTNTENLNKIQILQNRLLKVLLIKPHRYSTNKLHKDLSILKFEDIVKQELMSFTFNYIHRNLPVVFENYFQHRWALDDALSGDSRLRFKTPEHSTIIGENTVKVKASNLFNNVVSKTNLNCKIKSFRNTIKTLLLNYND